jgi:hypothetical protein
MKLFVRHLKKDIKSGQLKPRHLALLHSAKQYKDETQHNDSQNSNKKAKLSITTFSKTIQIWHSAQCRSVQQCKIQNLA